MKKIVIIDDEAGSINCIKNTINLYIDEAEVVGTADCIKHGIETINYNKPDILILDIDLGVGTGFDLLNNFQKRFFDVIFITAHSNFAIKAFKFSATDYLVKPFELTELRNAINKAGKQVKFEENSNKIEKAYINEDVGLVNNMLALPYQFGYDFIDINEIYYLISDGNYVNIVHKGGKPDLIVSKPLNYFENILCENGFLRTHNRYIVNMSEIKSYLRGDGGNLVLKNGSNIPVSRKNKTKILMQIHSSRYS